MVMARKRFQIRWLFALGVFFSLAGCASSPQENHISSIQANCSRNEAVLQEAYSKVQYLKSEMARVQIKAAKQEAELFAANQQLLRLRKAHTALQKTQSFPQEQITGNNNKIHTLIKEPDQSIQKPSTEKPLPHKVSHHQNLTPNSIVSDHVNIRLERLETNLKNLVLQIDRLPHKSPMQDKILSAISEVAGKTTPFQPTMLQTTNNFSTSEISLPSGHTAGQRGLRHIIVERGDTLTRIARIYGSTIQEIQDRNQLARDVIYIGQELVIPLGLREIQYPIQP